MFIIMKKCALQTVILGLALLCGNQNSLANSGTKNIYSPTGPVIAAIKADITANRLTRPTGNNAMENIHRLGLIAPGDPRIRSYKDKVAAKLISLGEQALQENKHDQAKILALRALKVAPHYAEADFILNTVREAHLSERNALTFTPPKLKDGVVTTD